MNLRFALSVMLLLMLPLIMSGQYYDTGQDPAGLKWLQIKTGRFRVIYPEKYGPQGIDFARSLDKAYYDLGSLFPERISGYPL